jgi:hypothetical protein
MVSIISACLFFTATLGCHILVSRILLSYGIKSLRLLILFAIGFLIHLQFFVSIIQPVSIGQQGLLFIPLPFTAALLYILLFVFYLIYYLSTYSGEIGPSIKIYLLMRRYGKRTFPQILREFSESDLIEHRLMSLLKGQFVSRKNNTYTILPKGKQLADAIRIYRAFVRWPSGG